MYFCALSIGEMMNQHRNIPFSPPDISELEIQAVSQVLRSGWITTGPVTKRFEKELASYIGVSGLACLNSATAALEAIMHVLGIGEGDEVIVPAYTYTASASIVYHAGAKIQLVDCAPNSFEMNLDELERRINHNTKAIIPVDLAGIPCNYDSYFQIVEKYRNIYIAKNKMQEHLGRIAIVADAAHAFGARRKFQNSDQYVGQIADFSAFSFHAVKNLTTAEGGAVCWSDRLAAFNEEIYKEVMLFSLHGQNKDALSKTKVGAWSYDIIFPGYKCNMTDIMATIGSEQLKRFPKLVNRRVEIQTRYDEAFTKMGLEVLAHQNNEEYFSTRHLYILRIPNYSEEQRDKLIILMGEKGVSCNVHYKPLPLLTAYKNKGFDISNYPEAFARYKNSVTLPLHTLLSDEDVEYIINSMKECLSR